MKNIKVNPLRLLFIGMAVIFVATVAKITEHKNFTFLFILGLLIEFISVFLLLKKLDNNIKKNNNSL